MLCFFSFSGWSFSRFCLVRLRLLCLLLLLLGGLGLLVLWRFVLLLCLRPAVCCVLVRVVRCLVLPVLLVSVVCVVRAFGSSCLVGVCCLLSLYRFSLGVSSRAFFFFRSFSFFCSSRLCSLPPCGWAGSVPWLLFLAAAFFVPFFFWLCLLVWFCLARSCCCLCLPCLAVGRLCGAGSPWLVFCLWFCLVCLCACASLVFFWGFVPLFFCAIAIAQVKYCTFFTIIT